MNKWILSFTLVTTLFSSSLFAKAADISAFSYSLQQMFGIDHKQLEDIAEKISIKYSTRMNPNAAATYTPLLKKITFNPELSIEDMGIKRVRSLPELEQSLGLSYGVHVSTIFHEFAHAELDTIIKRASTGVDFKIQELTSKLIKPWFQRHFPKFNAQSSMHEFYAYYRTEFMDTLFSDLSDLYLYNGLNPFQNRCYASPKVKELRKVLTRDEFKKILIPDTDKAKTPYATRLRVQYVYVNAKEIDMNSVNSDPFPASWYQSLYDYMESEYKAPKDLQEFAAHIRDHSKYRQMLADCRDKLWDTLTPSKAK